VGKTELQFIHGRYLIHIVFGVAGADFKRQGGQRIPPVRFIIAIPPPALRDSLRELESAWKTAARETPRIIRATSTSIRVNPR